MKKRFSIRFALAFGVGILAFGGIFAQYSERPADPQATMSEPFFVEKGGEISFSQVDADFAPILKNLSTIHQPQSGTMKANFQQWKAEANLKSAEIQQVTLNKTTANDPLLGNQFPGQPENGYPNDNHLAISNGGKIVSVTNSIVHTYDESGGAAESVVSLSQLGTEAGANQNTKFDPKVLYDPVHDRFIIAFLSGTRAATSQLVLGFSQTNNPADGWNLYVTTGSTHPNSWSDFPQIGITKAELFVTTNNYTDVPEFLGSTIWQIELAGGYAGGALTMRSITTPFFSLVPVTGGDTMIGPDIFLIRTREVLPNREVHIHRISNTIAAGGVLEPGVGLQSDRIYNVPPDATQPGTNATLLTNDTRIQDCFIYDRRIQFVLNTAFNNRPGIYFGTITLSPFDLSFSAVKGIYITDPTLDLSYPAIAYAGSEGNNNVAALIGLNYSSANDFPGNAVMLMDGEGVVSNIVTCKQGRGFLGIGVEANRRWGDYTGLAPRYNNTGEAWLGASFGTVTGGTDSYITQIFSSPAISVDPSEPAPIASLEAFPNPAYDFIRFEMKVESGDNYRLVLRNVQGQEMEVLLEEYLRPGTAWGTINVAPLAAGLYLLTVENGAGNAILTKKIIRE